MKVISSNGVARDSEKDKAQTVLILLPSMVRRGK